MKAKLGSGKRFAAFVHKLEDKGYSASSAKKIAASAGRNRYGAHKMAMMAAEGRRRSKAK